MHFAARAARVAGILTVIAGLTGAGTPLAAQTLYGTVTGTVADSSGAAVPGVTVSLTNQGTGLEVTSVTDDNGAYAVRNLLPGAYTLRTSLQGFKSFVQTGIPVTAGSIVRVNAGLELGALNESVTVVSETALLKTDKADVSVELKGAEITNLPLNQFRNYQTLINLVPGSTPGVVQNSQGSTPQRSLRTSVNGTNPNNNSTRIDGAASINLWLPHHAGYVAPAETIDTVNVSTNNFEAETGMAGGAAITVVTKSGTNELRGSAFYFRNQDEFNAGAFFDNANGLPKADVANSIYGGTVGGPVKKNRLFYFGSWERFKERRGFQQTFTVPTARMRNGDFGEVLAAYPAFRLYDPLTGTSAGAGRAEFGGAVIPAARISSIARRINDAYPMPNTSADINRNNLADDYVVERQPLFDRNNYDVKVSFNRSSAHQIWGKVSYLWADIADIFQIGFDEPAPATTRLLAPTIGHTWTLSPSVIVDGSFGVALNTQDAIAPDFGQNWGTDTWGIPGTNGADPRQGGQPTISTGLSALGNTNASNPYFWKTRVYSLSHALTRVSGGHEMRFGYDMNYLSLTHWQPEQGAGPRGRFDFSGNVTGAVGYQPLAWNQYASFLLGLPNGISKSLQAEEMTAREWQHAFYARDRWQVNNRLTLTGGLRFELYPLMHRADRGIERLDLATFDVLLGGRGGNPDDLDIDMKKLYVAPRLGAVYRLDESSVFRAGYGITYNPLPWSRPMRGFFPLIVAYSDAATGFAYLRSLDEGIPPIPQPDVTTGRVPLPRGVAMRTPNPGDVDRATLQQWNVTYERRIPFDISASIAYVGTRTDGGYADVDLNWAPPGTGNAGRQYFTQAGTATILDWGAVTRSRYHALQLAVNRPFKKGLLLKGAYTWGKAMNEADEDGWVGLTWNAPDQRPRNYARAGFDRTHTLQMAAVYELPFMKERSGPLAAVVKDWQANAIFSAFSGLPFTIGGNNPQLQAPGSGSTTIEQSGEAARVGEPGPDEVYLDPSVFSHPSGLNWGNSGRNAFRGPSVWNLDFSLFRTIPIGRYRFEFRAQAANVLNHSRWGNPNTDRNSPNFMKIFTVDPSRTVQLGFRLQF